MQQLTIFLQHHVLLASTTVAVFIILLLVELMRSRRNIYTLSPNQAIQLINHHHAQVIDIRAEDAFKNGHIINANHLPDSEMQKNPRKLEKYKGKPIIVVCNQGGDAQKIAAHLRQLGFNAFTLANGFRGWEQEHYPVVKK